MGFLCPCIYFYDQQNKISFLFLKMVSWLSSCPSPSHDPGTYALIPLGAEEASRKETPSDIFSKCCHHSFHPWEATVIEKPHQYIQRTCKCAILNIVLGNFSVHSTDEEVLFNNTLVPASCSIFRGRKNKVSDKDFISAHFLYLEKPPVPSYQP